MPKFISIPDQVAYEVDERKLPEEASEPDLVSLRQSLRQDRQYRRLALAEMVAADTIAVITIISYIVQSFSAENGNSVGVSGSLMWAFVGIILGTITTYHGYSHYSEASRLYKLHRAMAEQIEQEMIDAAGSGLPSDGELQQPVGVLDDNGQDCPRKSLDELLNEGKSSAQS